jgi:hypothetical protein
MLDYMYSMVDCVLLGEFAGQPPLRLPRRTGRITRRTGRGSEGSATFVAAASPSLYFSMERTSPAVSTTTGLAPAMILFECMGLPRQGLRRSGGALSAKPS